MSSTDYAAEASSLVRVTFEAGERRADLALPGGVPVAELLPEIVRQIGLLDPEAIHTGFRLVAQDGREIGGELGLTAQSVVSGEVLSLIAGADEESERQYDDIVEAMSDAVEADLRPWQPSAGRTTALTASVLLFGLGALTVVVQRPSVLAGAAAGAVAIALLTAAVVLGRVKDEHDVAVVLAWMAVAYAVVCGITVAPAGPLLGLPVALGSLGALIVGAAAIFGLVEHRQFMVPAVAVGAVFAVSSALIWQVGFSAPSVYAVALVIVVIAGSAVPWVSVGSAGVRVPQAHSHVDLTADPEEIDPDRVRAQARIGHEMMLGITVTVGVMLVLVMPLLVDLGIAGALLGGCAAGVLMLRTRQYRSGSEVLAGLASGIAALFVLALSAAVAQPDWRPGLAVVLGAVGAALMLFTLLPSAPSVRRGRWGDVTEVIALVALLPLLVIASGVLEVVRS